jgi:myo-inositol-1(or 4)-monophosphatase
MRHVHLGANALELCYVADGTLDAFVDLREKIRITDFAAAYLIAKEAGARITNADGGELRPRFELGHGFSFVASATDSLHSEILRLCKQPGRRV